jgi:hypothetical protein
MNLAGAFKTIVFVIIGLFIFKLASGYISGKFPNSVTKAVDNVVQAA